MAKVGNEAKLILSLAKERMAKLRDSRCNQPGVYQLGYDRAHMDWLTSLDEVIAELEAK